MKRAHALVLVLLVATSLSGCARAPTTIGAQRATTPSMADSVGPTGMSRDTKSYLAADPP